MDVKGTTLTHGPVEFHDCKIILDSPAATVKLSHDLSFADVVFTRCTVFYNGGPIVFVPVKVGRDTPAKLIGQITFENCTF